MLKLDSLILSLVVLGFMVGALLTVWHAIHAVLSMVSAALGV